MAIHVQTPAVPLSDLGRVQALMREDGVDLILGKEDSSLHYLSGHYSDSTLCHFYDDWACALVPARQDLPAALVVQEYDLAYQATRPTWLPELRVYGSPWSSAGQLLADIQAGQGIETELRKPLRELYERTRATQQPGFTPAVLAYVREHLGTGPLRIACDDLRYHAKLKAALGERVEVVDAQPLLRRIRAVKTAQEIAVLTRAAQINAQALDAAARAIHPGAPWGSMVQAYRQSLASNGAKPLGERGMLFNSGPDGSFVLDHDYVEQKTFKDGDTVVMDAICEYRLYRADMARTAVVGAVSAEQRRMFAAVRQALEEAEGMMRAGVHTSTVTARAAEVMSGCGYRPDRTTLTMHPIGLQVFDYVEARHESEGWTLESNAVVNFEVFYRDSAYGGVHLEDSVLISENGAAPLVPVNRDLLELR